MLGCGNRNMERREREPLSDNKRENDLPGPVASSLALLVMVFRPATRMGYICVVCQLFLKLCGYSFPVDTPSPIMDLGCGSGRRRQPPLAFNVT